MFECLSLMSELRWDMATEYFPQANQIVDWFHACEYLVPVAKVAFKDEPQREAWVAQTKTALWEGCLDDVLAACQQHVTPDRDDDPARKAVRASARCDLRHLGALLDGRSVGIEVVLAEKNDRKIPQSGHV